MSQVPEGFPRLEKNTRPWKCRLELDGCTRTKPCHSCLGARNRRKGLKKQRMVAKEVGRLTGVPVGRYSSQTGNEENWRSTIRCEAKAGKQAKGTVTAFENAEAQSEAAHAIGDGRPFSLTVIPDGWPDGDFLWIHRNSELPAFLEAFSQ